jgi:hypothetical protein
MLGQVNPYIVRGQIIPTLRCIITNEDLAPYFTRKQRTQSRRPQSSNSGINGPKAHMQINCNYEFKTAMNEMLIFLPTLGTKFHNPFTHKNITY